MISLAASISVVQPRVLSVLPSVTLHKGYIPIAFVANFPGVARFGVELDDIVAGILASDTLQVCVA